MDTNEKVGQCLLCGLAVKPGEGRVAGKSLVHSSVDLCEKLKEENEKQRQLAIQRKRLREKLVVRAMGGA